MTTGIIFDIKRYAIHDGPGIRTTVFMKGCPLACPWCHNPEGIEPVAFVTYKKERCIRCGACVEHCPEGALLIKPKGIIPSGLPCKSCFACTEVCPSEAREAVGREMTAEELLKEIKKDIPFYDTSGGGVTFSGGEPLMQPDFLLQMLYLCGQEQVHRIVDTSGYASLETFMSIAELTDLFLFDLKMMDTDKHERYTGISNQRIIDNLRHLADKEAKIIIRYPLIPGVNDDMENLDRTGSFLQGLPTVVKVDILPYHNFQQSKYICLNLSNSAGDIPQPSTEKLVFAKKRLENYGLNVAIGG
jgi:pyruvate formate lyase activating enzyme